MSERVQIIPVNILSSIFKNPFKEEKKDYFIFVDGKNFMTVYKSTKAQAEFKKEQILDSMREKGESTYVN